MNFVDLYSLSLHLAIAEKMLVDGEAILRIARSNLDRWLRNKTFAAAEARPYLEWRDIVDNSSIEEIRRLITADTDEGQRLRSSSPFTGVLTKAERESYWSKCAEIRPV